MSRYSIRINGQVRAVDAADDPPLLLQTAFGPTALPGFFTRRELVERYAQAPGRDLSAAGFYYRFGLFKTAVVAQQIYY